MGANLIAYTFVGPKEVYPQGRQRAVEKVKAIYEFIDQVQWRLLKDEEGPHEDFDFDVSMKELQKSFPYMGEVNTILDRTGDWPGLVRFGKYGDGKPERIVDEFLRCWSGEVLYRDMTSKDFATTNGNTWHVLVASDTSWGDAPTGPGYRLLRSVNELDFALFFGIQ